MQVSEAPIFLEDERVLLRPLRKEDDVYFKPFARSEPELWAYSLVGVTEHTIGDYVDQALADARSGKSLPFIVYDKQKGAYAGSTRYYDINLDLGSLIIGYTWYGNAFQGTGLNKHCKYLLLSYAFGQMGIDRVEFRADARNARSIAAMRSIGCQIEGVLRSHLPLPEGGRRDSIILSILKNEWFDGLKERLKKQL